MPAAVILAAAALAACTSSATPSADPVASYAAGDGWQVTACAVLAAMKFDATTMDQDGTTQDQVSAAMNLLPVHNALGADIFAVEQDLVTLDTDLAAEQIGTPNATQQYKSDTSKLRGALNTVQSDCARLSVPFAATLHTAS